MGDYADDLINEGFDNWGLDDDFDEEIGPISGFRKRTKNMTTNSAPPISIAEVCELDPDSWVNAGLVGRVTSIADPKPTKTGGKMWVCKLQDTTGSASVEYVRFQVPKFGVDDVIEIVGQGIKFKTSNFGPKIQVGEKADVHVVTKVATNGPAPSNSRPVDNERRTEPAGAVANGARPGDNSEFHKTMKRIALMYCHAKDYAAEINKRSAFTTPEQEQACVSTLFIEGARRNLIDIAPARGAAPAPAQEERRVDPKPSSGRADPKPADKPRAGPDGSAFNPAEEAEDVPF